MESLGRLADNLPRNSTNALNAAEAGLQSAFRGSALAITTLLRAAQNSTKKAFEAGYSAALQDIQEYLQQGLDVNQGRPSESIAHIIDYIEARQEAIKSAGSEADEDDIDQAAHSLPTAVTSRSRRPSTSSSVTQNLPPTNTSTNLAAAYQHSRQSRRQRSNYRSTSPAANRPAIASQPGPSSTILPPTHDPLHPMTGRAEPSHASSSAPTSPESRNTSVIIPQLEFSNPPSSASVESPISTLHASTSSQSPLTRLQTRRGRDKDRRMQHRQQHRERTRDGGEPDRDAASAAAGMKRRWTTAILAPAVDMSAEDVLPGGNADDRAAHTQSQRHEQEQAAFVSSSAYDMDMDEGGARPAKRTIRR